MIVTDGSLGYGSGQRMQLTNEYYPLHEFHEQFSITCEEAYQRAKEFTDNSGNHFRCVGYAGMKNGPTLVWQIKKEQS